MARQEFEERTATATVTRRLSFFSCEMFDVEIDNGSPQRVSGWEFRPPSARHVEGDKVTIVLNPTEKNNERF